MVTNFFCLVWTLLQLSCGWLICSIKSQILNKMSAIYPIWGQQSIHWIPLLTALSSFIYCGKSIFFFKYPVFLFQSVYPNYIFSPKWLLTFQYYYSFCLMLFWVEVKKLFSYHCLALFWLCSILWMYIVLTPCMY